MYQRSKVKSCCSASLPANAITTDTNRTGCVDQAILIQFQLAMAGLKILEADPDIFRLLIRPSYFYEILRKILITPLIAMGTEKQDGGTGAAAADGTGRRRKG